MADVVDDDILTAMRAHWATDPDLPAIVDEAPKAGLLKAPQTLPYAKHACEFARRDSAGTDGAWHDYRKATIQVYGVKADVVAALAMIGDLFNRNTTLILPSGARFMRWWPNTGDKLAQEKDVKDGFDVWCGTIEGDVWTIRT